MMGLLVTLLLVHRYLISPTALTTPLSSSPVRESVLDAMQLWQALPRTNSESVGSSSKSYNLESTLTPEKQVLQSPSPAPRSRRIRSRGRLCRPHPCFVTYADNDDDDALSATFLNGKTLLVYAGWSNALFSLDNHVQRPAQTTAAAAAADDRHDGHGMATVSLLLLIRAWKLSPLFPHFPSRIANMASPLCLLFLCCVLLLRLSTSCCSLQESIVASTRVARSPPCSKQRASLQYADSKSFLGFSGVSGSQTSREIGLSYPLARADLNLETSLRINSLASDRPGTSRHGTSRISRCWLPLLGSKAFIPTVLRWFIGSKAAMPRILTTILQWFFIELRFIPSNDADQDAQGRPPIYLVAIRGVPIFWDSGVLDVPCTLLTLQTPAPARGSSPYPVADNSF